MSTNERRTYRAVVAGSQVASGDGLRQRAGSVRRYPRRSPTAPR